MTALFRHEALNARRQQWLGDVQLTRPVSLTMLVTLVLASAVAVGAWLMVGEYTRKAHVAGVLVPEQGCVRRLSPRLSCRAATLCCTRCCAVPECVCRSSDNTNNTSPARTVCP
jgi:hypothetical protein